MNTWNLQNMKNQHIINCLRAHDFNRTHTAKALGIGIRTLQRRLITLGLNNCFNEEAFALLQERRSALINTHDEEPPFAI